MATLIPRKDWTDLSSGDLATARRAAPLAPSCLRRVRASPPVPLLRRGAHRPEGGGEARQARPVLVTPGRAAQARSAGPRPARARSAGPGSAPAWLLRLADAAGTMIRRRWRRPPPAAGRRPCWSCSGTARTGPTCCSPSAVTGSGCTRASRAFPGGAIDAGDGGPVGAALREAAEEVGLDLAGVNVVGALPEVFIERSRVPGRPGAGLVARAVRGGAGRRGGGGGGGTRQRRPNWPIPPPA